MYFVANNKQKALKCSERISLHCFIEKEPLFQGSQTPALQGCSGCWFSGVFQGSLMEVTDWLKSPHTFVTRPKLTTDSKPPPQNHRYCGPTGPGVWDLCSEGVGRAKSVLIGRMSVNLRAKSVLIGQMSVECRVCRVLIGRMSVECGISWLLIGWMLCLVCLGFWCDLFFFTLPSAPYSRSFSSAPHG